MPTDERSLSEGKTIGGKLLPANVKDPVSIGGENTRTDKPGSQKSSDPMQVREFSDKFRVERLIGQGGMGEVYLAFDLKLNRPVAIKAILGQSVNSEAALQRFMTEAQAIAKIIHTHIVNIYELGQDKIGPYLVLEYVSGGSLADKLKSGPLSLERSIEITCQLCDGLAKVHAAGIIHRDIKPANILLTPEGDPKLTDFGLARHEYTDTGLTTTGAMIGTLGFMSPEQTNSSQVDARSDIYSLGATLYQMVTGRSPRVMNFNHVPNAIRDVLHKATEEIVEDRFQSVIDFRDALRGHRVVISVYDFNEGECPSCSTKNDPTRKFCKKCANPLIVQCLSCSESIRVWEEVCDHCGAKQSLLIAERKKEMSATQLEAEDLLSNYDFDKALTLAKRLRYQSDPRLRQFKTWAEEFIVKIEEERMKAHEYISSLMSEASAFEKDFDYQSALDILNPVHHNLRELLIPSYNEGINDFVKRLHGHTPMPVTNENDERLMGIESFLSFQSSLVSTILEIDARDYYAIDKSFLLNSYDMSMLHRYVANSEGTRFKNKSKENSLTDLVIERIRVEADLISKCWFQIALKCYENCNYDQSIAFLKAIPSRYEAFLINSKSYTILEFKKEVQSKLRESMTFKGWLRRITRKFLSSSLTEFLLTLLFAFVSLASIGLGFGLLSGSLFKGEESYYFPSIVAIFVLDMFLIFFWRLYFRGFFNPVNYPNESMSTILNDLAWAICEEKSNPLSLYLHKYAIQIASYALNRSQSDYNIVNTLMVCFYRTSDFDKCLGVMSLQGYQESAKKNCEIIDLSILTLVSIKQDRIGDAYEFFKQLESICKSRGRDIDRMDYSFYLEARSSISMLESS